MLAKKTPAKPAVKAVPAPETLLRMNAALKARIVRRDKEYDEVQDELEHQHSIPRIHVALSQDSIMAILRALHVSKSDSMGEACAVEEAVIGLHAGLLSSYAFRNSDI